MNIDGNTSRFMDSVRGGSAMLVLLAHVNQIFVLPKVGVGGSLSSIVAFLASYAVMAFFVISGFMITVSILNNIELGGRFYAKKFLVNRIGRLYPPLIFSLLLVVVVYYLIVSFGLHGSENFRLVEDLYVPRERVSLNWENVMSSLFFMQNIMPGHDTPLINGPLWSLGYEFWFYILAMFFTAWFHGGKVLNGALPFLCILSALIYVDNIQFFVFLSTWCSGSMLALSYFYVRQKDSKELFVNFMSGLIICLTISAIFIIKINGFKVLLFPYRDNVSLIMQSLCCWMLVVGLSLVLVTRGYLKFNYFSLHESAKFSYTLYVIHFPILILFFSFTHEFLAVSSYHYTGVVCFIAIALILFASSHLSRVVEKRGLGRSFFRFFRDKFLLRVL